MGDSGVQNLDIQVRFPPAAETVGRGGVTEVNQTKGDARC